MRPGMCLVRLGWAALVAGAALSVAAEPVAAASTLPTELYNLSVREGTGADGTVVDEADVFCDPEGGSHPDPKAACAALKQAGGRLENLPRHDGPCTRIYQPVTAVATGLWHGNLVRFERTYGNRCELQNALGPVFAFGPATPSYGVTSPDLSAGRQPRSG